jgi:hypothetical protein
MTSIHKVNNVYIYKILDLLGNDCCQQFINIIDKHQIADNTIIRDSEYSKIIWEEIKNKIRDKIFFNGEKKFKIIGLRKEITITKCMEMSYRHFDSQIDDCQYKLFFYLNKINAGGGTYFYDSHTKERIHITNDKCAGVLFNVCIEHMSEPISSDEIKYVVGVRPLIEYM